MTFVSCVKCKRKLARRTTAQNRHLYLPFFFSSKGPYYMPMCHIDGGGGLRSTMAMSFHAATPFICPKLAWRGMPFLRVRAILSTLKGSLLYARKLSHQLFWIFKFFEK